MFLRKPSNNNQNSINIVKLKNGSEAPESTVLSVMQNLKLLMKKNPIAFYELVQKCKNPRHNKMFGNTEQVVEELGLMDSGLVHDITKNIVLSAVQGDGLDTSLSSPINLGKTSFNNRNVR